MHHAHKKLYIIRAIYICQWATRVLREHLIHGWALNRRRFEKNVRERDNGLDSILCNLDQRAFGEPAYLSVESKAVHLLYFVVKNHPFIDGKKRSTAFLFVNFLNQNRWIVNQKGDQAEGRPGGQ